MRNCRTVLLLSALVLCAFIALAQTPSSQIQAEIDRLERSLKDKPITSKDFSAVNEMVSDSLKGAKDSLKSGHLYLAMEELAQAEDLLSGGRTIDEKSAAIGDSLPAFEAEWNKTSLQLTAYDQEARKKTWSNVPIAWRALAEAAQGRSIPLLDGGRGFATATKPQEGLFYVGQAQGEAEFAKFCSEVHPDSKPSGFELRSYLPELQKLQQKTNDAFRPPKSIELHPRFIALNSALKLAQELDSQKFYAGSLYQYLEATRQYGMLDTAVPEQTEQSKLKLEIESQLNKTASSEQDDSIAQLFLERASSYIAHNDGSAPTPDEWKAAQVIVEQVLPAYLAAQKPARHVDHISGKTVTLTLVRWPYT
ncbi:MAG TPA: hypothetical protein VHR84_14965 [Terriglobales bacterium]|jgi:hypothetical protein|nr:hypothetical protein [Terriglobales bacterium]